MRRTVVRVPRPLSCLFSIFFLSLLCAPFVIGITVALAAFGLLPIGGPSPSIPFTANIEEVLLARLGLEQRAIEGDPARFDPFQGLAQVQAFAGADAQLIKIRAFGVRNDGTLDLTATYRPAPETEYTFIRRLAEPPPNAPPPGAGGTIDGVWHQVITVKAYRPGERRHINQIGGGANIELDYTNKGLEKETRDPVRSRLPGEAIAAPICSTSQFWQQALTRGATPDAVAEITYEASGYSYVIRGSRVNVRFGPDCAARG